MWTRRILLCINPIPLASVFVLHSHLQKRESIGVLRSLLYSVPNASEMAMWLSILSIPLTSQHTSLSRQLSETLAIVPTRPWFLNVVPTSWGLPQGPRDKDIYPQGYELRTVHLHNTQDDCSRGCCKGGPRGLTKVFLVLKPQMF